MCRNKHYIGFIHEEKSYVTCSKSHKQLGVELENAVQSNTISCPVLHNTVVNLSVE